MHGISKTLSRLPVARAFLAGAALLTGAAVGEAGAQTTDDTAFAMPRIDPRGLSGIGLPQPLPPSEAARIRRIFALQARGDFATAQRETAVIDLSYQPGRDMLGHVLAQRYLAPSTRPEADDLRSWLQQWPSLPDATAIHSLLMARRGSGARMPAPPFLASPPSEMAAGLSQVPEESEPANFALSRNAGLDRSVHEAARANGTQAGGAQAGGAQAVERLLARNPWVSAAYASQLRGEAAQILFTLNQDGEAYALGAAGLRGCTREPCQVAALPGYIAGLAAWRMDRMGLARQMFEAAAKAELASPSLRAAVAFWAGRSQLRTGHPAGYRIWLTRAAVEANTFYGMLARRVLGIGFGFSPDSRDARETLSEADIEAVAATPEGLRAFSLLQVGQPVRAEAELRRLWVQATASPALARALMLVSQRAGLAQLAGQYAELVQIRDGRPREATRFPVPRLVPDGGFRVDPAMVYGVARTESNFDTSLVSRAGAVGLMQIMPQTASFLTGGKDTANLRGSLRDPGVNLALGQRYITYLAGHEVVDGDLLRLLASYNAGPGNFGRWGGSIRDLADPLLFLEAIPIDETRAFVPRVLTNTWIYAARMRLPSPSLDELAAGLWPRFHRQVRVAKPFATMH